MKIHSSGNLTDTKDVLTFRLILTSIVSTFAGSLHFGYQLASLNPLANILKYHLVLTNPDNVLYQPENIDTFWSTLVGLMFIGALIGSNISTWFLKNFGPRKSLLLSAIILFSTPLFGLAGQFDLPELLPISRILSGFGIGMGCTSQTIYLTHLSPPKYRGLTNSISGVSANCAFFLAAFLGIPYILGNSKYWPIIFFLEVIPCLIHIVVNICYFYESPKYLMSIGKIDEAEKILQNLIPGENRKNVKEVIEQYREESKIMADEKSLLEILKHRSSFRALSLASALNFAVAFCGITALSFFGSYLLSEVDFNEESAKVINCLTVIPTIISAIIGTFIIDRINRRTMLIISLIVLAILNCFMMTVVVAHSFIETEFFAWIYVFLTIVFIFVFSIGIGPIALFIGAELAPPGTTSKIQSFSVGVQYLGSFISPIIFMKLHFSMGPSAFLLFIIPLLVTSIYFYIYLPESRGKTSTEINELLRQ